MVFRVGLVFKFCGVLLYSGAWLFRRIALSARGNSGGWGVGDKTWCSSIIFVPAIYFPYFCSLFIVSVFKLLHDFSSFYFCKKHI